MLAATLSTAANTAGRKPQSAALVRTAARNTIDTCGSGTKRVSAYAATPTKPTEAALTMYGTRRGRLSGTGTIRAYYLP